MEHDVFISYSHLDAQIANALMNKLEDDGINCWIAPRNISPGQKWADAIAKAIPKSKVFIIVFSANANSSEQVLREVEIAIQNKLLILPVKIEDIMPTGGMLYYLSTTHWIDVKGTKIDSKLSTISKTVKSIITSIQKGEPPADVHTPTDTKSPKNKLGVKALVLIVCAVVVVAAGVTLFMLRDTLFNNQQMDGQTQSIDTVHPDTVIDIENQALKGAIISALENMGEIVDNDLTAGDMQKLETLRIATTSYANWYEESFPLAVVNYILPTIIIADDAIDSLDGLEYASNLKQLMIGGHNVSDLSPLKSLTTLTELELPDNNITYIEPVENLTNLQTLDLSFNTIADIEPVNRLINLRVLMLGYNKITDISVFEPMDSLTTLVLSSNNISDISVLSNVQRLDTLAIDGNAIKSLVPIQYMNVLYVYMEREDYVTNAFETDELERNGTEIIIVEYE